VLDIRRSIEHGRDSKYHVRMSQHASIGSTIGRSVLRHPFLVVVVAAAFAAAGYYWSSQQNEQYVATTRLFLSSSSPFDGFGSLDFVNNPDRYAVNQAELVLSRPVLDRAVADGELTVEEGQLGRALSISAGRGTDVIVIEATAPTGEEAAEWANATADAYRAFKVDGVEQQTQELLALSTTPEESASILKRAAVYGDGIALVEEAAVPSEPSYPQPVRDGLIAGVVGLVLGVLSAVLVDVASGAAKSRRASSTTAMGSLRAWSRHMRRNPHEHQAARVPSEGRGVDADEVDQPEAETATYSSREAEPDKAKEMSR
jgi:uncharacterized protein involved in exopolysaccharide biosynthesis